MTTETEPGQFARELRRWRGSRRLSQLDLADRAGTTQRHLSFLEQGRSQPGRAVVLRLAESLGLSLRERNALLISAGYAPAFTDSSLDAQQLKPVLTALRAVLDGHMPYPALIVNAHGTLIEANPAFALFLEGCAPELLEPPLNTRRLALHPNGLAPRVINLPEWGRHVIDALRTRVNLSPDPALSGLVAELEGYLPPLEPNSAYMGFAVPLRLRSSDGELRLVTTLMSFATTTDVALGELRLEAFLPEDETTAEILRIRADRGAVASNPPVGRQLAQA